MLDEEQGSIELEETGVDVKYTNAANFAKALRKCADSVSLNSGLSILSRRKPSQKEKLAYISTELQAVVNKHYRVAQLSENAEFNRLVTQLYNNRINKFRSGASTLYCLTIMLGSVAWFSATCWNDSKYLTGSKKGDELFSISLWIVSFLALMVSLKKYDNYSDSSTSTIIDIANLALEPQNLMIAMVVDIDVESYTLKEWVGSEKSYTKPIGQIDF